MAQCADVAAQSGIEANRLQVSHLTVGKQMKLADS